MLLLNCNVLNILIRNTIFNYTLYYDDNRHKQLRLHWKFACYQHSGHLHSLRNQYDKGSVSRSKKTSHIQILHIIPKDPIFSRLQWLRKIWSTDRPRFRLMDIVCNLPRPTWSECTVSIARSRCTPRR